MKCWPLLLLAACAGAPVRTPQDDLAHGKPGDARRGFEKALDRDPHDLAAIRGRIEAAKKQGELAALLRELESGPKDAYGLYAVGLARYARGDEAGSLEALRAAVALRPGEADIQYRLGVVLLEGEKFPEARGPLAKAAELSPKTARYRAPLALCLGRLGDHAAATAALRDVPALQPTAEEAALAVKTARSLNDPFRDLPPAARAELELALGYLVRDAPGLAVPPLEALLQKLPDLAPAHALLGLAAARLDESGRAVTELKRAAELAPDAPQPHAYLAELYAGKGKPELAVQEYGLALERDPLDLATLRRLGTLRLDAGDQQALGPLRAAGALSPDDDGLQLLLARAELAAGDPQPARGRLERLAERRPEDAEVLLRLALVLYDERAKAQESVRDDLTHRVEKLLERVLSLQPENATASRLLSALHAG